MSPVFRWSGAYFGFITDAGALFDAAGRYVGWVANGLEVWRADGTYLGELVGAYYVLRATGKSPPPPRALPAPPAAPVPPPRPAARTARDPRPGYVDALDAIPADGDDPVRPTDAQAHLAAVVESSADAIVSTDSGWVIQSWNPAAVRLFGYTAAEMVGRSILTLVPPDQHPEAVRVMETVRAGGRVAPYEAVRLRRDGTPVPVSVNPWPVRDAAGAFLSLAATYTDLTERRRAEAELRAARASADRLLTQLRAVVASMTEGLVLADPGGNLLDWNPAALRIHGYATVEEVRRNVFEFAGTFVLSPPDGPPLPPSDWPMARVLRGVAFTGCELVVRRTDADWERVICYSGAPVRGADGAVELGILTFHDVTGHRALEHARARLAAVVESAEDAILSTDCDGLVVTWNPAAERLLGYAPADILGRPAAALVPPEDRAAVRALADRAARGEHIPPYEAARVRKDGARVRVSATVSPVRGAGGPVVGVAESYRDLTDQDRAAAAAREWQGVYEAAVQATGQLLYHWDAATDEVRWGGSCAETLGYAPDEMPRDFPGWVALIHPDDRAAVRAEAARVAATGDAVRLEYRVRRKDGADIVVEDRGHFVREGAGGGSRMVGFVADVTDRKRLEDQYRQAQKMEAVGQLAGGVAHDFNNLLTVINGYSELLLLALPRGDAGRELVEEIRKAGDRSANLTRQLLAFSRRSVVAPRVLDPNDLVRDVERMLRRLIGEDIDLAVHLQPEVGRVRADPGHLEQVVVNLAVNARDAMPTGGKLTVSTRNTRLDEEYARAHPEVRPGRYVLLAVTDTGVGMTAEVKAHVFEPFFTTKAPGKGTGLGLATVHGIVRQSGGHVEVYSEPGVGTAFKVYLPRCDEEVQAGTTRSTLMAPPRGDETLLLVEDEDAVRAFAGLVLRNAGYTVLEAANGDDAVQVAQEAGGRIHLLVTDVVMPGLGGRDLAAVVGAMRPGLRVLYLSGYTDDAVVRHGVLDGDVNFLQKPFTPAVLARAVRDALDTTG